MPDWRFWKKTRGAGDPQPGEASPAPAGETAEAGETGDEWDFLRSQPDHDADEMKKVHGRDESAITTQAFEPGYAAQAFSQSRPAAQGDSLDDLGATVPVALTGEDRTIGALVFEALGIAPGDANGNGPDPTADPAWNRDDPALHGPGFPGNDLLDMALNCGVAAGLLPGAVESKS